MDDIDDITGPGPDTDFKLGSDQDQEQSPDPKPDDDVLDDKPGDQQLNDHDSKPDQNPEFDMGTQSGQEQDEDSIQMDQDKEDAPPFDSDNFSNFKDSDANVDHLDSLNRNDDGAFPSDKAPSAMTPKTMIPESNEGHVVQFASEHSAPALVDNDAQIDHDPDGDESIADDNPEYGDPDQMALLSNLDPNDPVVARFQEAMIAQMKRNELRLDAELLEKSEEVKRLNRTRENIGVDLYAMQQQLARMQMQLEKTHDRFNIFTRLRGKAEEERAALLEDLALKAVAKEKALAGAKQASQELNQANMKLRQITEYNNDLKSDITVTRRTAYAEEAEMAKMEKEKKMQDYMIDQMNRQIQELEDNLKTVTLQVENQKKETAGARDTIKLALDEMSQIKADKNDYISKWKSSLIAMSRRDAALEQCDHEYQQLQVKLLTVKSSRDGVLKAIQDEQETNEQLTAVLTKVQTDCKFIESQIERIDGNKQKLVSDGHILQSQLESIDAQLQQVQSERGLVDVEIQRIQKGKSNCDRIRTEKENEIFEHMSSQATGSQALQNIMKNIGKVRKEMEDKEKKMAETENEIARIKLDILNTEANNKDLLKTLSSIEKELSVRDALVSKYEAEMKSRNDQVQNKQNAINGLNRKLEAMSKNVIEDNSSGALEGKIEGLEKELNDTKQASLLLQRQWIGAQTELVELEVSASQETEKVAEMKARHTILRQKEVRIKGQKKTLEDDIAELRRSITNIHNEITRINGLLAQFKTKQEILQAENHSKEREAEDREDHIQLVKKQGFEKIAALRESKAQLVDQLADLSEQILLWERKISLEKETQKAIDPELGQAEVEQMRKEVHRMELQLQSIKKRQAEIMEDGLRAIEKRDDIQMRHLTSRRTELTKSALARQIATLKADIKKRTKEIREVDESIRTQEASTANLTSMCESLHAQFQELEEKKAAIDAKLELGKFQKHLASEILAIFTEAKSRLANPAAKLPEITTTLHEQTERLEALKVQLRTLKSEHSEYEPYFDSLLSFATLTY